MATADIMREKQKIHDAKILEEQKKYEEEEKKYPKK